MVKNKPKKAWHDLESEVALEFLKQQSKIHEPQMPNLEVGAIVSGEFLLHRQYNRLGQTHCYKIEADDRTYFFEAIPEHLSETVTAIPVHPFYELIEIVTR